MVTTTDPLDAIPDTLRRFSPTDEAGNVQAQLGLIVTMYVMGGGDGPIRDALQQLAVEFDAEAGEALRWVAQTATARWRPVNRGVRPAPPLVDGLSSIPAGNEWGVAMHCGSTMASASALAFAIHVPWEWERERLQAASYVTAHYPVDYFAGKAESFRDRVARWAALIKPLHGYAGLGLNLPVDARAARGATAQALPVVLRAAGLELDNPVLHAIAAHAGIKSVNWLTILSDALLAQAGGRAALQADLGQQFTFRDYAGGSIIQSGQAPQIGDVNRALAPEEYRVLATRLLAIREPFFTADTNADFREWLTRFDRMIASRAL